MTRKIPGAVRGRPPTVAADASLRLRLPSALLVELRRAARARGQSDAELVRAAIVAAIGPT